MLNLKNSLKVGLAVVFVSVDVGEVCVFFVLFIPASLCDACVYLNTVCSLDAG